MTSAPQTSGPQPDDPQSDSASSGESLEEKTEQTAEIMADARVEVERAKKTLHDQILPEARGGEAADIEDYEEHEGSPNKDDTRGGWPNWS